MRNYNIRLEKYGISKSAYEELRAFCFQYGEKKEKIKDIISLRSPVMTDMPHGGNLSDPTAKAEEKAEKYREDIELIEKTAKEVDEFLAPYIVKSVTQDVPAWVMITNDHMPATVNAFNKKRRQFYVLLAIKKNMI